MSKYIAHFQKANGQRHEITATTLEFKNRLDFYNWICQTKQGEKHGKLIAIEIRPIF